MHSLIKQSKTNATDWTWHKNTLQNFPPKTCKEVGTHHAVGCISWTLDKCSRIKQWTILWHMHGWKKIEDVCAWDPADLVWCEHV